MTTTRFALQSATVVASLLLVFAAMPEAMAQAAPASKASTAKASKPVPKAVAAKPIEPAAAGPEQLAAAGMVYYGTYACEFNQSIDITESPKHASYVSLKHGKFDYLMKPVLSSTGAIRLEDVRGETLMVQISNKSMLLNVKTSQRIVDDCVSEKQREAIAAAKLARNGAPATPMLSAPAR